MRHPSSLGLPVGLSDIVAAEIDLMPSGCHGSALATAFAASLQQAGHARAHARGEGHPVIYTGSPDRDRVLPWA